MKVDFDHFRGSQLADEMQINLTEQRMFQTLTALNPNFSKDGNQFCYLYGENLQVGIAGFGNTVYEAMVSFCNAFWTQKA